MLDPDGKVSPAQVSNKLKKLGLTVGPKKKLGNADEPFSTGEGTAGVSNHKSVNLEGSLSVQHV